jgi:hypothetical protein
MELEPPTFISYKKSPIQPLPLTHEQRQTLEKVIQNLSGAYWQDLFGIRDHNMVQEKLKMAQEQLKEIVV